MNQAQTCCRQTAQRRAKQALLGTSTVDEDTLYLPAVELTVNFVAQCKGCAASYHQLCEQLQLVCQGSSDQFLACLDLLISVLDAVGGRTAQAQQEQQPLQGAQAVGSWCSSNSQPL
jgi:hypothetical protein